MKKLICGRGGDWTFFSVGGKLCVSALLLTFFRWAYRENACPGFEFFWDRETARPFLPAERRSKSCESCWGCCGGEQFAIPFKLTSPLRIKIGLYEFTSGCDPFHPVCCSFPPNVDLMNSLRIQLLSRSFSPKLRESCLFCSSLNKVCSC